MTPYKSKSGKPSGVTAYETGGNFIKVEFNHAQVYTYSYRSAGRQMVEEMKTRALAGQGLSTFISQNDPGYV
ncbi:hypothetical protein [Hufsiella ginkgonis]|uniref:KTSC domain-containing protein n=1 Tax=Hufsiella ginkgonis TaxID=2695274 RepID=A0A7K1XUY1_9SPHI|nr:hypothetical protein [Hufsiella ginkgonis]MXV14794.1 hypothetical protein [Hufsiella ginkgonis]